MFRAKTCGMQDQAGLGERGIQRGAPFTGIQVQRMSRSCVAHQNMQLLQLWEAVHLVWQQRRLFRSCQQLFLA